MNETNKSNKKCSGQSPKHAAPNKGSNSTNERRSNKTVHTRTNSNDNFRRHGNGRSGTGGGVKKMFPTDNDARKVDVASKEQQEKVRHNKKAEELAERGQNMQMGSAALTAGTNALSRILGNHPSWYLSDPALATQTTQISTQIPIGINQEYLVSNSTNRGDGTAVVISYGYMPVIAMYDDSERNPDDANDVANHVNALPINYVSKALYAYVKNACRRNLNYAPGDLIRTLYAVIDAYCDLECVKRVYRLANTYKFLNRTLSETMISACGFKPEGVYDNLSNILFRVNRLGKMLQTVHIPKGQTIYDRSVFLCNHVFKDIASEKSRYFLFRKMISYRLEFGKQVSGYNVSLRSIAPNSIDETYPVFFKNYWNIEEYLTGIENRVTALLDNSEILSALADMLTAFESNGFHEFEPLLSDESQEFVYDPVMVRQVRNATLTGIPRAKVDGTTRESFDPSAFNIYDLGNGILAQGTVTSGKLGATQFAIHDSQSEGQYYNWKRIRNNGSYFPKIGIDTFTDYPDAGELLVVSRLCTGMALGIQSDNSVPMTRTGGMIKCHGTEIVSFMNIFYYDKASPSQHWAMETVQYPVLSWGTVADRVSTFRSYLRCMCYNALPRLVAYVPTIILDTSNETIQLTVQIDDTAPVISLGDIDHVIYIDNDMLSRWHFVAIASELSLSKVVE